ncbi:hypothetical protein CPB86DRAFT_830154 [Serendipita vermifera]|nr:hypothetical protein CPB86DRAFT_830154 [Serendipita vermifera]
MSFGGHPGPSQHHHAKDERPPGTPASMTPKERKRRQFENAINSAILAATVARSAGDSTPLLGPLKGLMGSLIGVLENVKGARKFEEDWEELSSALESRIKMLQEYIDNKPASVELQELVSNYKQYVPALCFSSSVQYGGFNPYRILERVVREVDPLAKRHKIWSAVSSSNDSAQIRDITRRMDGALKDFTTQLQMRMEEDISHIYSGQQAIEGELMAHRTDHARTHARILEIQEDQRRMEHVMEDMHTEQRETRSKLTEAEEVLLLKGLTTAHLANGDNHEVCMKGTRSFILDEARLWADDENGPQIFWLADVAGSGKSTVANHLAREWKSRKKLAGQFFFSRDVEQTRTSTYFFNTIAQQGLSHLGSAVRTTVVEGIRDLYDPIAASIDDQCMSLFVRPLEKTSSTVVLVLDALDECDPANVKRLFRDLLPQLANLHGLKVFLTSRPESYINEILGHTAYPFSLTSNQELNRSDVKRFMGEKLRSIQLPEAQVEALVKRSEGLFIWASTVCKILQTFLGNRDTFISNLLVQRPRQMDSVYQVALQQGLLSTSNEPENLQAHKRVLEVIVAAFEPLSPKAMDDLLGINNAFVIVKHLQSVLVCTDSDVPVRFLHPTFREFLLQPFDTHPCHINEEMAHINLAQACLDLMARDLRWNLCDIFNRPLPSDSLSDEDQSYNEDEGYLMDAWVRRAWLCKNADGKGWSEYQQLRLDRNASRVLQYSCQFWTHHLDHHKLTGMVADKTSYSHLEHFFHQNLLDWIYVLSFMKSIRDPWTLMRKLISGYPTKKLSSWANDTARFLKTHWNELRKNPLSVYHIFAFAPKSTIFQTVYARSQSFPHPVVTMGLEESWSADMSISTHRISTACLSNCGNWLATGGEEDSRPVYGLWNISSADGETHIHPCNTLNCYVKHVSFFEHSLSLRLQTFCECKLLCLWDPFVQPGILLDEVKMDYNRVDVLWSEDGSRLVVKEGDVLKYLWKRDEPLGYHILYRDGHWHWSFSPNQGQLLAADNDYLLEVWDCTTLQRTFSKRFGERVLQAVLPTNLECILVHTDQSIEYVSLEGGTTIWSIPGFGHSFYFFSNGSKIAINTFSEVTIVSTIDGSILVDSQTFSAEELLFHPEDEKLAIGLNGGGMVVWNPLYKDVVRPLRTSSSASPSYFSWCHQILVQTMDSMMTFYPFNLTGPGEKSLDTIQYFDFSPSGEYLVTITSAGGIQAWHSKSGSKIMTHNDSCLADNIVTLEFSTDSSSLLIHFQETLLLINIELLTIRYFDIPGKPGLVITFRGASQSGDEGKLVIKELSTSGRETHWPTAGCMDTLFSPDGSHIIVVENPYDCMREARYGPLIVSYLKIPEMTVQSLWMDFAFTEFTYTTKLLTNGLSTICLDWDSSRGIFDSRNGNNVVPAVIRSDKDMTGRYGLQFFFDPSWYLGLDFEMDEDWAAGVRSSGQFTGSRVRGNRVVITDMTSLIKHARGQPNFTEQMDLTKHEWLKMCMNIDKLQSRIKEGQSFISFVKFLDELRRFERGFNQLKQWSSLEHALSTLEDVDDKSLTVKLKKVQNDRAVMESLERLWNGEGLAEIQNLKRTAIELIQRNIRKDFEIVGDTESSREEKLRLYTLLCIRELRNANCQQRADWERVYKEIEIRKVYVRKYKRIPEEREWLNWMKSNTVFPDDTAWLEPEFASRLSDSHMRHFPWAARTTDILPLTLWTFTLVLMRILLHL